MITEHLRIGDLIDGLRAGVSVRSTETRSTDRGVLKTSSVFGGRFLPQEAKPIMNADLHRARCSPRKDSIIISRMNTPALVGAVGYVTDDHDDLFLPDRLWMARQAHHAEIDMRWLCFYLSSATGSRSVRELATGTSGSMKNIPKSAFLQLEVPVPSLGEQRLVAKSLDDAERLLIELERMVVKKQAIKRGMLQQLLTGNTRLPGFGGGWRTSTLAEIGDFQKGRGIKRDDVRSAGVPCIRYGELYTAFRDYTNATVSYVDIEVAGAALPIKAGDILFAGSGETRDDIGTAVAYIGTQAAVAGGDIIVLRGGTFNSVYVAALMNSPGIAAQKARLGQGDAVVHINSSSLGSIELTLPLLDEQNAIAAVIVDVDREIEALQRRLDKARRVKQGMMQELLTGRTRLTGREGSS